MNMKTDEDDRRLRDEKRDLLEAERLLIMKRCDKKIVRRRSLAEQREAVLAEELSRARAADVAKQEDIELAHRLAAELSRRRSKDLRIVTRFRRETCSSETQSYPLPSK